MSSPPTTIYVIVTLTVMMTWAVDCYDDNSGICQGPENVCRHSQNMLPEGVTQQDISDNFHARAFDSPAVCRRLDSLSEDTNFKIYAYFSCSLSHCYRCYDAAFTLLRTTYGCSGKDGGFVTLDGCCLRYETYDFCGAKNHL